MDILLYLMKNPVQSASAEYNDNRISLYAGQLGKCFVTGESLQIGNMETNHRKPRKQGGTDEYKNLCLVTADVHRLIHALQGDTIQRYCKKLHLTAKALEKLNRLRVSVGNCKITGIS